MPKLILPFLIFISFQQSKAQTNPTAPPLKRFGFQAGMNVSNMNFNMGVPAPANHEDASWKPGITLDFLLRIPLCKQLFLQPEYAFTQRNGSDKSLGTDYQIRYLSMPVLLNYQISPRITLLAGPQLEMLIDAKSLHQGTTANITHDVEERSIGITGGLEVEIYRSLFLSARYLQGLNHVGIGQRSDTKEFKYQAVQLTAGVRF